jgi:hypothetical protein
MAHLEPVIHCKNPDCYLPGEPMRLPYPNPPDISQGLPNWPTGNWKAYCACRECGRVYEYTAENVRWRVWSMPGPSQPHSATAVFCVEFECDRRDCGTQLKIHTTKDAGTTTKDIQNEVARGILKGNCENGHPLKPMKCNVYQVQGPI